MCGPYKKRRLGRGKNWECVCTENRPLENTARKQPSVGQGERPQGQPKPGGTLILDLQPLEQEKINFCALSHTVSHSVMAVPANEYSHHLWHFLTNSRSISLPAPYLHLLVITNKNVFIYCKIFFLGDKIILGENRCLTIHTIKIIT